jgi:protocatechuate 3,4-dioxygenase beta subunit
MTLSRRQWILLGWPLVAAGARTAAAGIPQGLDQFMANAGPPCTPDERATPIVPADATYRPGSPVRTSLVETGMAGTPLGLSGTVTGLTCGRIKGATVDIWQADARGVYDARGNRLRGRQVTDVDGRFHVETIVPGSTGARAPHLGVNVIVPGKANVWTELFFPDDPKNATDRRFRQELLLKMVQAPKGRRAATFDIVLDL